MPIETTDVAALPGRVVASITIEGDVSPRVGLTPAAGVLLATLWANELVAPWMWQCRHLDGATSP